jgi:hypothetical protein
MASKSHRIGPKKVDADDDVEAAQVEADAGDGEGLACDADGNVASDALARQAIAIGDGDTEVLAPLRDEPQATHGGSRDEVMRGARVK